MAQPSEGVSNVGEYEATGTTLHGDAWICGRTTLQQHFAGMSLSSPHW